MGSRQRAAMDERAHAQSDSTARKGKQRQRNADAWRAVAATATAASVLLPSFARSTDADDAHPANEPSPSLTLLLHLLQRTHARTLDTTRAITSCRRPAVARTARWLLATGPLGLLASREFDACLRVSESAAVRCCEPAAVAGNGLSSLATANWVSGTASVLNCGKCPVRAAHSSANVRLPRPAQTQGCQGRKIVMHLARRRTQADLH